MSISSVREYFRKLGIEDKVMEFDVSSATVELAAAALGCEGQRIGKTMAFIVDDRPILIVIAGDARIANPKFKGRFHTKARMIAPDRLDELVGHEMGGVCPFAIREGVEVYLDESLKRFQTVFPAAGSANSAIELSLSELERYAHAEGWVDVCKDWE